jgi:hypothetical protein
MKINFSSFCYKLLRILINKSWHGRIFNCNKTTIIIKWFNKRRIWRYCFEFKKYFSQFAVLAPKNEHCDETNNTIVIMLPGQEKRF